MPMPNIRLIGTPASRVMRNIWMLTELKLPFESDPIVTTDPALKQPPYTEWNPNAKIPICIIDGFAVYESLAINLYLDMKFPSQISLNSIEEKGQGMQWAMWVLTEVEMHSFNWYLNTIGKPEAERDATVRDGVLGKIAEAAWRPGENADRSCLYSWWKLYGSRSQYGVSDVPRAGDAIGEFSGCPALAGSLLVA